VIADMHARRTREIQLAGVAAALAMSDMTMSANGNNAPTIQKPGANTGRLCNPLLRKSCLWSTLDPSVLLPVGKRKSAWLTLK
jgi:hypothetical protein